MKKEFTKNELLSNRGCFSRDKVNNLKCVKENKMNLEGISKDISLKDFVWFLFTKCEMNNEDKILLTIDCVEFLLAKDEGLDSLKEAIKNKNIHLIKKSYPHPYITSLTSITESYLRGFLEPEMVSHPFTLILEDLESHTTKYQNKFKKEILNFIK